MASPGTAKAATFASPDFKIERRDGLDDITKGYRVLGSGFPPLGRAAVPLAAQRDQEANWQDSILGG